MKELTRKSGNGGQRVAEVVVRRADESEMVAGGVEIRGGGKRCREGRGQLGIYIEKEGFSKWGIWSLKPNLWQ